MKYTSFYTIKEQNYKAVESILPDSNLPADVQEVMKKIIADHKEMVKQQKKIIEEQNAHASALFHLFDDPILQKGEENKQNPPGENEEENNLSPEPKPNKRNKGGKNKLPQGKVVSHSLSEEEKSCPCCKGKMYKQNARTKTYVLSLPMLSSETHVSESYRCIKCETQTTANNKIENECIGRYHFSAVASIAALRYQCGMASYRLENMSDAFGIKIADSTQWSLFEDAASLVRPFVCFLEKEVANVPIQHVDDTHNIVLSLVRGIEAEQEQALLQGKNPKSVRSGIHTTNVTAVFPKGEIVLYKTGLHHSGEILAKLLSKRTLDEQIIIMADAASANTSKINLQENENIKIANCNSHAIRKFKEVAEKEEKAANNNRIKNHVTSEYLDFFLSRYKIIFKNEQKTKKMSPTERLVFHQNNSLPLMLEMKNKVDQDISKKIFEPSDEIGKIYAYFSNHFKKLRSFCDLEGAPVCNNLSERMLKFIILHRKNSLFFKTQIGAAVADIMTTILFTAKTNNINSVDYLRDLMLHQELWKKNPQNWLPWNYPETIKSLKNLPE